LGGDDASNYTVSQPSGLKANITAKNLTINGASANNKTYDSTTDATVNWSGASLVGVVGSEDVSIDSSGYLASFASKHVGLNKAVTVVGVVLGGSDASNYTVSQPSGLTANIGQARLDIYAVSDSKTYDGTVSSSGMPTVSGLQGSTDTVTGRTQRFQSKNEIGTNGSTLEVGAYTV